MAAAFAALHLLSRRRRVYRDHDNAFDMPDDLFRRDYRSSKSMARWLCGRLRGAEGLYRRRTASHTMSVEQQVLCALRFFATGSFQAPVATDRNLSVSEMTVSRAIRAVASAIVTELGHGWVAFPRSNSGRSASKEAFMRRDERLAGAVAAVDGTLIGIVGPPQTSTTTKDAYWCRKHHYALNVRAFPLGRIKNRVLNTA